MRALECYTPPSIRWQRVYPPRRFSHFYRLDPRARQFGVRLTSRFRAIGYVPFETTSGNADKSITLRTVCRARHAKEAAGRAPTPPAPNQSCRSGWSEGRCCEHESRDGIGHCPECRLGHWSETGFVEISATAVRLGRRPKADGHLGLSYSRCGLIRNVLSPAIRLSTSVGCFGNCDRKRIGPPHKLKLSAV